MCPPPCTTSLENSTMISKTNFAFAAAPRFWAAGLVFLLGLALGSNALAYKVERVCETSEPTVKKPATKTCKTLLVRAEPGAGKDEKKEAKKEEKPAGGHH